MSLKAKPAQPIEPVMDMGPTINHVVDQEHPGPSHVGVLSSGPQAISTDVQLQRALAEKQQVYSLSQRAD